MRKILDHGFEGSIVATADLDAFSRGFDAGNYDFAYASESLALCNVRDRSAAGASGYLLGFFSSCELHEIPEDWREAIETLRAANPEFACDEERAHDCDHCDGMGCAGCRPREGAGA